MGDKKPDETKVLGRVVKDLESLPEDARARVLTYVMRRFLDSDTVSVSPGAK